MSEPLTVGRIEALSTLREAYARVYEMLPYLRPINPASPVEYVDQSQAKLRRKFRSLCFPLTEGE